MWKEIKDWPEYKINEKGEVKRNNKILKHGMGSNGYPTVVLCRLGKPKSFRVHRLLCLAFIPNPECKPQVNHKDGDKENNSLDNLEWVTSSENNLHSIRITKNRSHPRAMLGKFGKDHNQSKSFYVEFPNGLIIKYYSGLEFTRATGLDHSTISWVRTRGYDNYRFKRGKMKGLIVHFELIE